MFTLHTKIRNSKFQVRGEAFFPLSSCVPRTPTCELGRETPGPGRFRTIFTQIIQF